MDFMTTDFLSALFAIIVIDLMLAGDNAIVIALAARNVPKHLQRKAVLWGMAGAIGMRISMTMIVVWLLKIPGLLFVGGLLLVWIAYKLLIPDENAHGPGQGAAANSFWGAMRTIVVADAIMGLDNVLAVAGAAHGSFLLVVIGLLISVPIVIWGSGLILRYVERYPVIVYFGAGVLAWTAVKMIVSEPLLAHIITSNAAITPVLYLTVVGGVLWAGCLSNHLRLEARIHARLAELGARHPRCALGTQGRSGQKILLPVDGTQNSIFAVRHIVQEYLREGNIEIHLINVQPIFSQYIARFVSENNIDSWHHDQAQKALRLSRSIFKQHNIPFVERVEIGPRAEVIVSAAKRLECDLIVMSTARKNSLTRMLESSVTNEVLETTSVPVEIIAGSAVSKIERLGLPAGLGLVVVALLVLAFD